MSNISHIVHPFEPVFDENWRILILGSLPSVKSRENNFYYSHPKNRFWRLLSEIYLSDFPESITEKKSLLLDNGIALWDSVMECDIHASSDSSIKNVVPTDLSLIFDSCDIRKVYANGALSAKIYNKYQKSIYQKDITVLPSTSPANASWSFDKLKEKWQIIKTNK